jgi:hypothetical protein
LFYDCRRTNSVKKAPITIDLITEKHNEECKESPLVFEEKKSVENFKPYLDIETTSIESAVRIKIGHESKSSNMVIDVDVNSFSIEATSPTLENTKKPIDEISEGKLKTH